MTGAYDTGEAPQVGDLVDADTGDDLGSTYRGEVTAFEADLLVLRDAEGGIIYRAPYECALVAS